MATKDKQADNNSSAVKVNIAKKPAVQKQKTDKTNKVIEVQPAEESTEKSNETAKVNLVKKSSDAGVTSAESQASSETTQLKAKVKPRTKLIIIISIVAIAIIIALIGIVFFAGREEKQEDKTIKAEEVSLQEGWASNFYQYMQKQRDKDFADDLRDAESIKARLYEIEETANPVLVLSYQKDGEEYTYIYFIDQENKVHRTNSDAPSRVALLYSIAGKDYDYYLGVKYSARGETGTNFSKLADEVTETIAAIAGEEGAWDHPTYLVLDKSERATIDGSEVVLTEFDKQFVEVEDSRPDIDFRVDMTDKELEDFFRMLASDYETREYFIQKYSKNVEEKVAESKRKQEEITNTKNENENAQNQPEVSPSESSNQQNAQSGQDNQNSQSGQRPSGASSTNNGSNSGDRDGIVVGNSLVKFGTYMQLDPNDWAGDRGGRLVLRADGTATFTEGANISTDEPIINFTYKVENYGFTQDNYSVNYQPAIVFYRNGVMNRAFYINSSGVLRDAGVSGYKYIGE